MTAISKALGGARASLLPIRKEGHAARGHSREATLLPLSVADINHDSDVFGSASDLICHPCDEMRLLSSYFFLQRGFA